MKNKKNNWIQLKVTRNFAKKFPLSNLLLFFAIFFLLLPANLLIYSEVEEFFKSSITFYYNAIILIMLYISLKTCNLYKINRKYILEEVIEFLYKSFIYTLTLCLIYMSSMFYLAGYENILMISSEKVSLYVKNINTVTNIWTITLAGIFGLKLCVWFSKAYEYRRTSHKNILCKLGLHKLEYLGYENIPVFKEKKPLYMKEIYNKIPNTYRSYRKYSCKRCCYGKLE